jgi:uncharacterized protein (TIGR03086 family)
MDAIELLRRAVDQTGGIVSNVKPDQLGGASPCAEWDVRGLLNHTIGVVSMFDVIARGGTFDPSLFERDNVGDDPGASYQAAATKFRDALGQPGVIDSTWNMPFGAVPGAIGVSFATLELAQHGWDVAKGTGQQPEFDADVTAAAFAMARGVPAEQVRVPGVFGAETPCPATAPAHDQLAAFLGRSI